jgi:hypothetical protein
MTQIAIDIKSCRECPFFTTMNQWSSDGFDRMEDWCCTKHPENSMRKQVNGKYINTSTGKLIQGAVEWHEESRIGIPEWCPSKTNNSNMKLRPKNITLENVRKSNYWDLIASLVWNHYSEKEFQDESRIEITENWYGKGNDGDKYGCYILNLSEINRKKNFKIKGNIHGNNLI